MSKTDFSVFFDILDALEEKAFNRSRIRSQKVRAEVVRLIVNNSPRGAAQRLRSQGTRPIAEGTDFKYMFVRLPAPKGKAIAATGVALRSKEFASVQLDVILAQGGYGPFVLRFDSPHPDGPKSEHTYFHTQISESIGPRKRAQKLSEVIDGIAGSYPAIPVPALDPIELLVGAVLALYGRKGINQKLNGLDPYARSRVKSALDKVIGRCELAKVP